MEIYRTLWIQGIGEDYEWEEEEKQEDTSGKGVDWTSTQEAYFHKLDPYRNDRFVVAAVQDRDVH